MESTAQCDMLRPNLHDGRKPPDAAEAGDLMET